MHIVKYAMWCFMHVTAFANFVLDANTGLQPIA